MTYGFQNERDAADAAKLIRRSRQYGDVNFEEPIRQSGGSGSTTYFFGANGYHSAINPTGPSYDSRSGLFNFFKLGPQALAGETLDGVANISVIGGANFAPNPLGIIFPVGFSVSMRWEFSPEEEPDVFYARASFAAVPDTNGNFYGNVQIVAPFRAFNDSLAARHVTIRIWDLPYIPGLYVQVSGVSYTYTVR